MKRFLIITLLLSLFGTNDCVQAQLLDSTLRLSPGGFFDKVFDREGRAYTLSALMIPNAESSTSSSGQNCTTIGYFKIHYDLSWNGLANPVQTNEYQTVICRVLEDIYNFLPAPPGSPLANNLEFVNLWIRDISQLVPNSNSANVGALASSFYIVPGAGSTIIGGIIENQLQQTIISGRDAYSGVVSPLLSTNTANPFSAGVYHGYIAFNFNNPDIRWNGKLNVLPAFNEVDLYTVMLHEMLHALGIASLINVDGKSKFGSNYPYYAIFDSFIKDKDGITSLIKPGGACTKYNFTFNSPILDPSIMSPGCSQNPPVNKTVCANALRYIGSTNVPLYTPECFERPSSLSHFEDECYPTPTAAYGNDAYFVVSNATVEGNYKRFPKSEERLVLCDLGYSVNSTFGDLLTLQGTINYGSAACTGAQVRGINDGINPNNSFSFLVPAGGSTIVFSGITANDIGATDYECLEVILGGGSALKNGPNSFSFQPSTTPGLTLLRYIPKNGNQQGNITYIYVFNYNANCIPSACQLVNNGGFEDANYCGTDIGDNKVNCWYALDITPDIFKRNCSTNPMFDVGSNTYNSIPPADTYNAATNPANNSFLGLAAGIAPVHKNGGFSETVQTLLSAPLVNGQDYILTFYARNKETSGANAIPVDIQFCSAPALQAVSSLEFPGNYNILSDTITVPADGQWHLNTIPFTSTSNDAVLLIGQNISNYPPTINGHGYEMYVFIDDVSILPASQSPSFTISPSFVCANYSINNLETMVFPPGGTFSGPGISGTTFNAAAAGVGTHIITYNYAKSPGCTLSTGASIVVSGKILNVTASATPSIVCQNNSTTLTAASDGINYQWSDGGIGSSYTTGPLSSDKIYTVSVSDALGCSGTADVSVRVTPNPSITLTASPSVVCGNMHSTLNATQGFSSYAWSDGGNGNPHDVNPLATTVYSVIATDMYGCQAQAQTTVFYDPSCNPKPCLTPCSNRLAGSVTNLQAFGKSYCIDNDLYVNGNVSFNGCELKIAPGVLITVESGATLKILGSHLYSCADDGMWQGIYIKDGGTIFVGSAQATVIPPIRIPPVLPGSVPVINFPGVNIPGSNSFIEDAYIAIRAGKEPVLRNGQLDYFLSRVVIDVKDVIFNRNYLAIENTHMDWPGTTGVVGNFIVQNSIFTSRVIPFQPFRQSTSSIVQSFPGWPSVATLKYKAVIDPILPPYISEGAYFASGIGAALKDAPLTNNIGKPIGGVRIKDQGNGTGLPGASGEVPLQVGVSGSITNANTLVFDNLYAGVIGVNAQLNVTNSVFQNMHYNPADLQQFSGAGIKAMQKQIALEYNNYSLKVEGDAQGNFANRFYDCRTAVEADNYFNHSIKNCSVYSSRSASSASPLVERGKYGFFISSNRFTNDITSNNFYNIENGIVAHATHGDFVILSNRTPFDQNKPVLFTGRNRFTDNTFRLRPAGSTWAAVNGSAAITVERSGIGEETHPTDPTFGPSLYVSRNDISGTYNGILMADWSNTTELQIADNPITLANNPAGSPQYGIAYKNNVSGGNTDFVIYRNTVNGPNTTNPAITAIYTSMSTGQQIACNSTQNTARGIEFAFANAGTRWYNNQMGAPVLTNPTQASHQYGFVLSNGGVIGTQGDVGVPIDNSWGSVNWAGGRFKTRTEASDAKQSKMYVQNTTNFNPNGSSVSNPNNPNNEYSTASGAVILTTGISPSNCTDTPPAIIGPPVEEITGRVRGLLERIAKGLVSFPSNPSEASFIAKNQVYILLAAHPDLVNSSAILQSFYNGPDGADFRALHTIQLAIANGDFKLAQNLNTSLNVSNLVIANYQSYYAIYISYRTQNTTLSPDDKAKLVELAAACPFIDGAVVYEARALYNAIYHQNQLFADNCPETSASREGKLYDKANQTLDVLLYPNPVGNTSIEVTVLNKNRISALNVTALDVSGQVIYKGILSLESAKGKLYLNAPSGIYQVIFHNQESNEIVVKKLVITK